MKEVLLITRPIAPPWDEASKNFAYYLAKNITGLRFTLFTHGILPDLPENIKQKPIYTSNDFGFFQKFRLIKNLRKIENDFDILHYLFTPTKQNSFLIKNFINPCKNSNVKIIQTIATLREDLYSDEEIKKMLFGDFIITYSDYAKNKLNASGFKNVQRVYPGIDLNLYSPAPKNLALMEKLNLKTSDFIISDHGEFTRLGYVNDIVNFIINYAGELRKRNIKLVFAYRVKNEKDAAKKEAILKLLAEKKLTDLVRFPDKFTTLEKMYNLADVCLFPAQNMKGKFDIPLVVPEAMACGKPVILSDLSILKELNNDRNSVIIPKGNVNALAEAVFDLYDHPEKRRQIGQEARKFVEERFDIKKIAEKYREIYNNI